VIHQSPITNHQSQMYYFYRATTGWF
jgi:hypothetical protein